MLLISGYIGKVFKWGFSFVFMGRYDEISVGGMTPSSYHSDDDFSGMIGPALANRMVEQDPTILITWGLPAEEAYRLMGRQRKQIGELAKDHRELGALVRAGENLQGIDYSVFHRLIKKKPELYKDKCIFLHTEDKRKMLKECGLSSLVNKSGVSVPIGEANETLIGLSFKYVYGHYLKHVHEEDGHRVY